MANRKLARIFFEISIYLEMDNVSFKPKAYKKAAIAIGELFESVEEIYEKGGKVAVEKIPGVGKSIAEKIIEYIKTEKIKYYNDYRKKIPVDIQELAAVEGIGPKTIKVFWQKLKIKNLKDLEEAAKTHRIKSLFGFDEIAEENIIQGIKFLKRNKGRFFLNEISPRVKEIEKKLKSQKEVKQISVAGSWRRKKETIGDLDFLVASDNPKKVMDFFVSLPGVEKIWGEGITKSSIQTEDGLEIDLRVVAEKSFGSALQYFTGSKEHNIAARRIAIEKGLKLNEYGVFKKKKMIAGWSESGVYRAIGLPLIEPELRENRGELEAAFAGKLPKIIRRGDIKGDLHCHSKWSDGSNTIKEMADAALEMGYRYLGISDHTKFLRLQNGLDEKRLAEQKKEIDKLNRQFITNNLQYGVDKKQFKILQGCEANILSDGSIDILDDGLKKLDYVIAGIHSSFKMPKEKMTERIIRAMKNPYVKIISHPTARILGKRDECQIDFEKILKAAKEFKIILEINSQPRRMDLNDVNIRRAKENGVKMAVNTDAHSKDQMRYIEFGIAQARRGWAEKNDIINSAIDIFELF